MPIRHFLVTDCVFSNGSVGAPVFVRDPTFANKVCNWFSVRQQQKKFLLSKSAQALSTNRKAITIWYDEIAPRVARILSRSSNFNFHAFFIWSRLISPLLLCEIKIWRVQSWIGYPYLSLKVLETIARDNEPLDDMGLSEENKLRRHFRDSAGQNLFRAFIGRY